MNANELAKDRADILADELLAYHNKGVCGRAAKMLRQFGLAESIIKQQQIEIEELKATMRSFFEDFLNVREESDSGRVFAPITIGTDENCKHYIMDAITGSLYRPNGTCCTSDHLKLISYEPKEGLDKKLLAMKHIKALGGA